jgi:hypothetical protein
MEKKWKNNPSGIEPFTFRALAIRPLMFVRWIELTRFLRVATALPIFIKFNISNKSRNRFEPKTIQICIMTSTNESSWFPWLINYLKRVFIETMLRGSENRCELNRDIIPITFQICDRQTGDIVDHTTVYCQHLELCIIIYLRMQVV